MIETAGVGKDIVNNVRTSCMALHNGAKSRIYASLEHLVLTQLNSRSRAAACYNYNTALSRCALPLTLTAIPFRQQTAHSVPMTRLRELACQ